MRLTQGLVELSRRQITRAEKKIVAPFAATVGEVHKSDACPGGEIEGAYAGTIHVDGQIDKRRTVGLLVRGDAPRGNSVLQESVVAQAVELAFAGNADQLRFEVREIQ